VPERQRSELFALLYEKWIGANHERASPQLKQACESRVNVAFGPGMQEMELQGQRAGDCLRVSR